MESHRGIGIDNPMKGWRAGATMVTPALYQLSLREQIMASTGAVICCRWAILMLVLRDGKGLPWDGILAWVAH
jgi:hypothetical protein